MILLGTRKGKRVEYIMVHDMLLEPTIEEFKTGSFKNLDGEAIENIVRLGHTDFIDFQNIVYSLSSKDEFRVLSWDDMLIELKAENDTLLFWDFDAKEMKIIGPDLYDEIAIKDYRTEEERILDLRYVYNKNPFKISTQEEFNDWVNYLRLEDEEMAPAFKIAVYDKSGCNPRYLDAFSDIADSMQEFELPFIVISEVKTEEVYHCEYECLDVKILTANF